MLDRIEHYRVLGAHHVFDANDITEGRWDYGHWRGVQEAYAFSLPRASQIYREGVKNEYHMVAWSRWSTGLALPGLVGTLIFHGSYTVSCTTCAASRAPRALCRTDVESAWQGMHSSTAVSGGGVCWMIMPDNTSVNSRDDRPFCRVRCSRFCRAVSCHSCLCVRDAAVSLLRVPVHKACYDAGLLGCGRGGTHMSLGVAVSR